MKPVLRRELLKKSFKNSFIGIVYATNTTATFDTFIVKRPITNSITLYLSQYFILNSSAKRKKKD